MFNLLFVFLFVPKRVKHLKKFIRWPIWVVLATLIVAAVVATSPLVHFGKHGTAHAASSGPTLTASETTVHSNLKVQITAQGFAPNDQLSLYFDYSPYTENFATLPCDSNGNCVGTIKMPTPGVQGLHVLSAIGQQPNEVAMLDMIFNPSVLPVQRLTILRHHTFSHPISL